MIKKLLKRLELLSSNERDYQKIIALIPELVFYKNETRLFLLDCAKEQGYPDLRSYYLMLRKNPEKLDALKTNLTFKGTHFFRGEDWEFFTQECLAKLEGRKNLKIWSAACSSGEEAYSLVMALMDYVPLEDMDVLATDYNDELLERCREGRYFNMHLPEIPERYRCHVETGPKKFSIREELKAVVHTENLNLLKDPFPTGFDVILCRNVLKFFSREAIPQVQRKLAASLSENSFLFVSVDEDQKGIELIADPESMGLKAIDAKRGIYRRAGQAIVN
jgi:chemotaxis protein methyltransferase CheR